MEKNMGHELEKSAIQDSGFVETVWSSCPDVVCCCFD